MQRCKTVNDRIKHLLYISAVVTMKLGTSSGLLMLLYVNAGDFGEPNEGLQVPRCVRVVFYEDLLESSSGPARRQRPLVERLFDGGRSHLPATTEATAEPFTRRRRQCSSREWEATGSGGVEFPKELHQRRPGLLHDVTRLLSTWRITWVRWNKGQVMRFNCSHETNRTWYYSLHRHR